MGRQVWAVGGRDERLSPIREIYEPPVTAMNQSQHDAQEAYRRNQAATQAALEAAKQPLSADALSSLTLRDIEQMAFEVYKKHLTTNPAFCARVDELEAARPPRPRL